MVEVLGRDAIRNRERGSYFGEERDVKVVCISVF